MIIKFNLIPKEEITVEPKEKGLVFFKVYSSIFIFIFITLFLLGYNIQSNLKSLKKLKNEKEELLAKYKNIAKKIKSIERENEEIKKRIDTIMTLKSNQGKSLKNLATVITKADPNRVIFTNLKLDNTKALIKGFGLDLDFLAIYMQALEQDRETVKAVNLKTAQQKNLPNLKMVEFDLEVLF